ncbi:MAG: Crp/Fnr family transcriptional regulator [Bacteriovoracaceae bacterium]
MIRSMKKLNCQNCSTKSKSLFCELSDESLENISKHKISNALKKGDNIFNEGTPSFGLYCIQSGRVKITKTGIDGKEVIVRIADTGDVIGHRSIFSNQNYTATAKVIEDSVVCFFDKHFFFNLIKVEPTIAFHLIERLSLGMGVAENKSASIIQKNVSERLAELLLMLKETYGVQEKDRIKLDIFLTREELASMVGMAHETVIRQISQFKEDGLIMQTEKTIYILNEKKLIEQANIN